MRDRLHLLIVLLLFVIGGVPPEATQPRAQAATAEVKVYLPAVVSVPSLAGTYDCFETEFNMVWATEVITLSVDGSSIYAYSRPNTSVVTGTWVYTPTTQEIGLKNFRWITATVELPNRFRASRYVPSGDFYVGLSCLRLATD